MTYYFIKVGDNESGPFTVNQLKSKSIQKNTPVWYAGIQEWTNAGEIYELKELFVIKVPSRPSTKIKINKIKIWEHKLLKQQFKKVSHQFIVIRARKNLY
jgi:GYF domain 2